jgi:hypothetical protein
VDGSHEAPIFSRARSRYFWLSIRLRDEAGWQLTDAGHAFLITIEQTASGTLDQELKPIEVIVTPSTARRASTPLLRLVADNQAGRHLTPSSTRSQKSG